MPYGATKKAEASLNSAIAASIVSKVLNKTPNKSVVFAEVSLTGVIYPTFENIRSLITGTERYGFESLIVPRPNYTDYLQEKDNLDTKVEMVFADDFKDIMQEVLKDDERINPQIKDAIKERDVNTKEAK